MYLQRIKHPIYYCNCADNGAEIKRTGRAPEPAPPASYKNAEIMTPFVRTKWTHCTLARIFLFCIVPRVFYRNKGYAGAPRWKALFKPYILRRARSPFCVLREKNCSRRRERVKKNCAAHARTRHRRRRGKRGSSRIMDESHKSLAIQAPTGVYKFVNYRVRVNS